MRQCDPLMVDEVAMLDDDQSRKSQKRPRAAAPKAEDRRHVHSGARLQQSLLPPRPRPGEKRVSTASPQEPACAGLDLSEHLVIGAIRLFLDDPAHWGSVRGGFHRILGPSQGDKCLEALKSVIETLNAGARRKLTFRPVKAGDATADERAILTLLGAAEAGHMSAAHGHAAWLVSREWQDVLVTEAAILSADLKAAGLWISYVPRRRPATASVPQEAIKTKPPMGAKKPNPSI